jgi:hypothetical protein
VLELNSELIGMSIAVFHTPNSNGLKQSNLLKGSFPQAPFSAPAKRRLASSLLLDDASSFDFTLPSKAGEKENNSDGENVDPSEFASAKRSKGLDGTPSKVSKFILTDKISVSRQPDFSTPGGSATGQLKRKAQEFASESISLPGSSSTTPLGLVRGTLQPTSRLNRKSLLSGAGKKRGSLTGGAGVRRINPPNTPSGALPFSIDAALSGTISSYTPTTASALKNELTPSKMSSISLPAKQLSASVPTKRSAAAVKEIKKEWFFEIYEDTADEHASNMLQHSASVLDISSDDDIATAKAKDALERGKENVPPAEPLANSLGNGVVSEATVGRNTGSRAQAHRGMSISKAIEEVNGDAMNEDRAALREMDVRKFWGEGIIDGDEVVVIADEEHEDVAVESGAGSFVSLSTSVESSEIFVYEDQA